MTKRINFFDGFTSETTPDTVIVSAEGIIGTWQGAWVSQEYILNDAVYFNGSGYICILDTTAAQDPTDGTYWDLVVLKGESVDVDEGAISFDESKIGTIEALVGPSPLNRYTVSVLTDDRSNQALPAEISGDMTLNLLTWDGTDWKSHGQFIGSDGSDGADGTIGPQGPQGDPGEDATGISVREVPTGLVNGSNVTYTLSETPTSTEHISVFIDGNFQNDTEFSVTTNVVTMTTAPALGQSIFVWYSHSGTIPSVAGVENIEYHTVTGGEATAKQFTMSATAAASSKVLVDVIGGSSQENAVDFSIAGSTFDWSGLGLDGVLAASDVVRLKYFS